MGSVRGNEARTSPRLNVACRQGMLEAEEHCVVGDGRAFHTSDNVRVSIFELQDADICNRERLVAGVNRDLLAKII